jgi:hypothetical protein
MPQWVGCAGETDSDPGGLSVGDERGVVPDRCCLFAARVDGSH